jgi:hypothetical protein
MSSFIYTSVIAFLVCNLVFLKLESYEDNVCPSDEGFNETSSGSKLEEFWLFVIITLRKIFISNLFLIYF